MSRAAVHVVVMPDKQSFLIDTGYAGQGEQDAVPGDPAKARDANVDAAAHDAGVTQIDYLMITHFHPDHDGGVVELSKRMPIRHFVDHDTLSPARRGRRRQCRFERYPSEQGATSHCPRSRVIGCPCQASRQLLFPPPRRL